MFQNTDEIDVVLIHQKINLSKLLAPIGFRITWGAGEVKINELDARRHPSFSAENATGRTYKRFTGRHWRHES